MKLLESAEMRLCWFEFFFKRKVSNVSCSSCLGIGFDFRSSCEAFDLLLCSQKLHMEIRNKFLADFEY